jgi:17beta-estradiol 17-dehydrogenase / very-long-chain 3-oxoacyl-CoA reductase
VNVTTTAMVTRLMLPALLRHAASTGRRAALLNVGSIVGRFHWPGTQLYGACKAFIDHLTVPLAHEHRDQLDVLSFQPTVMATAMAAGTEPAAITIAPGQAARAALSHLGHVRSSHGHWRHALLAALLFAMPLARRNALLLSSALQMEAVERAKGA